MATYTSAHICYASIVIASACIRVYSRSWSAVQAVACTATVAHLVHCQCVNLVLVLQLVHHEEKKRAQTTVAAKMCILWHVEDWRIEYDRECSTMSRLNCEATTVANSKRVVVYKLKCKVCSRYEDKIKGRKNFSKKWNIGSESVQTSNVWDHSHNDQHMHAMMLLNEVHSQSFGLGPESYAPIAEAWNCLPCNERETLKVKSDIAHFVASENLHYIK